MFDKLKDVREARARAMKRFTEAQERARLAEKRLEMIRELFQKRQLACSATQEAQSQPYGVAGELASDSELPEPS